MKVGKIELALFGADGRGGMVKEMNDIKSGQRAILKSLKQVEKYRSEEKSEETHKTALSNKWKLTIYGAIFGTCGLIVIEVLKFVGQALL